MSGVDRLRTWWSHAFAVDAPAEHTIDDAERKLIDRLAAFIVRRRLTAPALMVLEVGRPLNFVGSQVLVFLNPFISVLFDREELQCFTRLLEKRRSIDAIVDAIAEHESGKQPST